MAKKFSDLRNKLSPDVRARAASRTQDMLLAMSLQEIRVAVSLTQKAVAEQLSVSQGAVSKLENMNDMTIGRVNSFIGALGGSVAVVANIAHVGSVIISNFQPLGAKAVMLPQWPQQKTPISWNSFEMTGKDQPSAQHGAEVVVVLDDAVTPIANAVPWPIVKANKQDGRSTNQRVFFGEGIAA